jgi:hypothetical protein
MPGPTAPAGVSQPLKEHDLVLFQKGFSAMVILFEDVSRIARLVSQWLIWQRGPFREDEALYALKDLEDRGILRIHDNVVCMPDAYDILEVRL